MKVVLTVVYGRSQFQEYAITEHKTIEFDVQPGTSVATQISHHIDENNICYPVVLSVSHSILP